MLTVAGKQELFQSQKLIMMLLKKISNYAKVALY